MTPAPPASSMAGGRTIVFRMFSAASQSPCTDVTDSEEQAVSLAMSILHKDAAAYLASLGGI